MLRVLHTADWHLGHTLHGFDRQGEHEAFLTWLKGVIVAEEVDALLIAGDVFDTANPPASALSTYYRFLADLAFKRPGLDVVVIGGNHDSAARLAAPEALLAAVGVRVVGGMARGTAPEGLLVPLRDASGKEAAIVAAMPFLRPADLPTVDGAGDPLVEGVRAAYSRVLDAARNVRAQDSALIAMGHCYMVGTVLSAMSERRVLGGNQHALPDNIFASDVAYVALGHLHKAQQVGWRDCVRYSGSPIPLSMPEADYQHQVVIADFDGPVLHSLRPLYVPRTVEMIRLPAAGLDEVVASLAQLEEARGLDDPERPFLEVQVELSTPRADVRERIEAAVEGKRARLVKIAITHLGREEAKRAPSGQKLSELDPQEVLRRRYQREFEGDVPSELLEAFDELLDEVGQAESA